MGDQREWCCRNMGRACPTTTPLPFNCLEGYDVWNNTWTKKKKSWCCLHQNRGCTEATSYLYDCQEDLQDWDTRWSTPKVQFCCETLGTGCSLSEQPSQGSLTSSEPFDCDAGFKGWETG